MLLPPPSSPTHATQEAAQLDGRTRVCIALSVFLDWLFRPCIELLIKACHELFTVCNNHHHGQIMKGTLFGSAAAGARIYRQTLLWAWFEYFRRAFLPENGPPMWFAQVLCLYSQRSSHCSSQPAYSAVGQGAGETVRTRLVPGVAKW